MSQGENTAIDPDTGAETSIADYLRAHPDFFERHGELLRQIRVPHEAGPALSLIERQVALLRERNALLERRLADLVSVAQENEQVNRRMHGLTLTLTEATDGRQVVHRTRSFLQSQLCAHLISFRLFSGAPQGLGEPGLLNYVDRESADLDPFSAFLRTGKSLCGRLRTEQLRFLFAERSLEVRSAALVPLGPAAALGMLGIGSEERNRFAPGMGTVFLDQMGSLIGAALEARG
jgi:uncharacterized protein YigA (DUF484 family)